MAVERLDINRATPQSSPRSRLASILGLRWRRDGRLARPSHDLPRAPESQVGHEELEREFALDGGLAGVQAEHPALRMSMHEILDAWREADRALAGLDAGSPEWAAVNATRLAVRASYLARFDEYQADDASS